MDSECSCVFNQSRVKTENASSNDRADTLVRRACSLHGDLKINAVVKEWEVYNSFMFSNSNKLFRTNSLPLHQNNLDENNPTYHTQYITVFCNNTSYRFIA